MATAADLMLVRRLLVPVPAGMLLVGTTGSWSVTPRPLPSPSPLGVLGFALSDTAPLPLTCVALTSLVRGYYLLLFVTVQVKAVEDADEYDRFLTIVGKPWSAVRGELDLSVATWGDFTHEEQWEHVANKVDPPMALGRAKELAREINKLLGIIREWSRACGCTMTP